MESLTDAADDRVIKDIVPPPHRPISDELLYPTQGKNLVFLSSRIYAA